MFKKYLTYHRYQKSIRLWAKSVGYQESDIDWVFPWMDVSAMNTHRNLVVVFEKDLKIRSHTCIYKIEGLMLLEKIPDDNRMVRFGVPEEFHHDLLAYVRQVAEAQIANTAQPQIRSIVREAFHPYLKDSFTVDIGVWVDGVLRGSKIAASDTGENVIAATVVRCLHDDRFKPLMQSELDHSIFEITLIPNLWITLDESYLYRLAPHDKALRCLEAGIVKSYYVPMIANCLTLQSLGEYLRSLLDKAVLTTRGKITFEIAPAFPAVENGRGGILTLQGPHPQHVTSNVSLSTLTLLRDNILANVDADGFIPIIVSTKEDTGAKLDVPRIGFVFFALSEYYALTKDTKVQVTLQHIQKMQSAIVRHHVASQKVTMSLIYNNQAAAYIPQIARQPIPEEDAIAIKSSPLGHSQYIKQLMLKAQISELEAQECLLRINGLYERWRDAPLKEKCPVQYADLLWLLSYSNLQPQAEEFSNWLRSIQQADGSFLALFPPFKAYTRGTGKVAEAAASVELTRDIAERAMTYLRQMQYTDATMYHIPHRLRDKFRHGFRHDVWNRDLWLDGSTHVLLTELRLLYSSTYANHLRTYLSGYYSALSKLD